MNFYKIREAVQKQLVIGRKYRLIKVNARAAHRKREFGDEWEEEKRIDTYRAMAIYPYVVLFESRQGYRESFTYVDLWKMLGWEGNR